LLSVMSMELEVREAAEEDAPAMLGLWREMMDFHAELDPRLRPLAPPEGERGWEKHLREDLLEKESACVLVAKRDGRVVGMIAGLLRDVYPVFEPEQRGFVSDISVAADARRQGVGRALFESLQAWFKHRGASHVEVRVADANPVSRAFWAAMGCRDYMHDLWWEVRWND
jgi:ribosomal protein S18 acetylase RimI-like enzyme